MSSSLCAEKRDGCNIKNRNDARRDETTGYCTHICFFDVVDAVKCSCQEKGDVVRRDRRFEGRWLRPLDDS